MDFETGLFINNEYVPSSTGETITVYDPANGNLVTDQVQVAGREDVDKAVAAAKAAFKPWKATPSAERASIMLKYADLLEDKADELALIETTNMGMPISMSRLIVAAQASSFRYYAGLVDKVHGETYNEDGDGVLKMVTYEPLGVCAGISAWNGTHLSMGWKIAPAVAMGNTFVHKSSERNPLCALFLGRLFKEAGFPPGVVNLLSGGGATGALLASHMDIAKISFTGSVAAGRKVQLAAAQSNLKHVTLELGGKSASIVFEDADIDNAIRHNSQNFLANNAQACSAASRLLVHESIAPAFIERLKEAWTNVSATMGDPADAKTYLGPMVDKAQADRVDDFVQGAREEGIKILVGSERTERGPGQFSAPTLLLNPGLDSRVWREEVFGPVMVVRTFKTEEEVVDLANDTSYGLSGIIFTSNISRALRVASKLEVGTLSINGAHWPSKFTPWGGWKQSGYGRESGLESVKERKVKCRFNRPGDIACINCSERETTCISQRVSLGPGSGGVVGTPRGDHLAQSMERVNEGRGSGAEAYSRGTLGPTASTLDLLDYSAAKHAHGIAAAAANNSTVVVVVDNDDTSPQQGSPYSGSRQAGPHAPGVASTATSSPAASINHPYIVAHQRDSQERHRQIARHLHSLLPPPHLRSLLANESPGASMVLTFAHSRGDQMAGRVEPNWSLASATWPTPDTHPTLIAKRLMQFTICMQSMPPGFDVARMRLPGHQQACELLGAWVGAVGTLVAGDDELVGCAEGIETLALLGMFQADAGHLRRAWMTNRRGLDLCLLLGVDSLRQPPVPSCAGANDPKTLPSMPVLWYRLNCIDRYNSLILGLPLGSRKDTFARVDLFSSEGSPEKLAQEHAIICRRIADRNDLAPRSTEAHSLTRSIEGDFDRAAGIVDSTWWTVPTFPAGPVGDTASSLGPASHLLTPRSAIELQVRHFTLLILLHLPYLLRNEEGHGFEHNRQTCMGASSAVLERFLVFRKNNVMNVAGRHVDYSALIAAMTLLLGHLGHGPGRREYRASDRDVLERTLLIFRELATYKRDRLATESADTIHQLLPIIAGDDLDSSQGPLKLTVPFLGTVNINPRPFGQDGLARPADSTSTSTQPLVEDYSMDPQALLSLDLASAVPQYYNYSWGPTSAGQTSHGSPLIPPDAEDWVFQGIDTAYWSMLSQSIDEMNEGQAAIL
ncbi:hypothetical protein ACJZ2D_002494 [Fusarium nematophilum]